MTKIFRNDRLCLLRIDLIEKVKTNNKNSKSYKVVIRIYVYILDHKAFGRPTNFV